MDYCNSFLYVAFINQSDLLQKGLNAAANEHNEHNLLAVPRANHKAFGDRAFAHSGPFPFEQPPS